jgi:hypothetical protein
MADPFASIQPSNPNDSGGPGGNGSRGRTIAVVVLAIVVAIVIAALIWAVVAANGKTPKPSPTQSSPIPSPSSTSSTPTASGTTGLGTCAVGDLRVTLGAPSGAAGSTIRPIVFTNTGSGPCELHGFPGVSFVGDGNGTQLGAAADQDQSAPVTQYTLQPGDAVHALLKIVQAANVAGCTAKTADGLRVYPPHSSDAVFVKASGLTACTESTVHLLTIQPVTTD